MKKTKKVLLPLLSVMILTVGLLLTAVPVMAVTICPDEYHWNTSISLTGFEWDPYPDLFRSWNDVHFVNSGPDAFNVVATISYAPANVVIVDGVVTVGDISAGSSAWSSDFFELETDMTNPLGPDEWILWRVEYDDAAGVHHVIENVPKYCWEKCELEITKTCFVPPPSVDLECESKIAAMLLRYIGPNITGVDVEFKGDSDATAMYTNVDLISGVTVLSDPLQNNFTIDAAASGKRDLGAKTKIYINGDKEVIHTSCSTPFVAGAPAPLNNPKGDPSLNWFVESFRDKNGNMVEPPLDPVPSDECMIQLPGGTVEYTYTVNNTGGVNITNIAVIDDVIGVVPGSPIAFLAPGDSVTLTATQFLDKNTTNTVTATGYFGTAPCVDTDTAEVIVLPPPPPPFECKGKIKELTMIWDGDKNISEIAVYRDKYDPKNPEKNLMYNIIGGPIRRGDNVAATGYVAANAKNDVDWLITFEDGTTGISRFHLSCSDKDMNGPEDCGKPQGDGKKNKSNCINDWVLEGMVDSAEGILDCTP